VRSVIGQGSTFLVQLPAEAESARSDSAIRRVLRGSCVLVVGRSSLRATLEPALVELGLDHEWVTSGAAAGQAAQHKSFEVVLVDAGMRSSDDVVRGFKTPGPEPGPSVILFTSGEEVDDELPHGGRAVPLHRAALAVVEALTSGADAPSPNVRAQ